MKISAQTATVDAPSLSASVQDRDALVPTVVLYDIMREAANRVRGRLVALEDAKTLSVDQSRKAQRDLQDSVDKVDASDRVQVLTLTATLRNALAMLPIVGR